MCMTKYMFMSIFEKGNAHLALSRYADSTWMRLSMASKSFPSSSPLSGADVDDVDCRTGEDTWLLPPVRAGDDGGMKLLTDRRAGEEAV